jgi:hypothetical protein
MSTVLVECIELTEAAKRGHTAMPNFERQLAVPSGQ